MSLKTFIISEEIQHEHASRFLLYQERYHQDVFIDLRNELFNQLAKSVTALNNQYKSFPDEATTVARLNNPDAVVEIIVDNQPTKIITARIRDAKEVAPSVKIPLLFSKEERDSVIKELLLTSEKTFNAIADQWKEIFRIEKNGRAIPWFKIVNDQEEVRFQLAMKLEQREMNRTLYAVRIEFGKKGSKLKDFDRLFLISLI